MELNFNENKLPQPKVFNLEEIINLDKTQILPKKNLIILLSKKYNIHPHKSNKIIIFDKSIYCYKIGLSDQHEDVISQETKIYQQAKNQDVDMFFESVNLIGTFKNYPKHGIYQQKKLIVYKNIDFNAVIENWINLYGIDKLVKLNNFLERYKLYDIIDTNLGWDNDLLTYKFIDYEFNPNGKFEGKKQKFDLALELKLMEVNK